RFFTKVKAVDNMWREVLPNGDFSSQKRLSRIYFNRRYFYYPLRPVNALFGLGFCNSLFILLSYFKARCFPQKPEETFEQWVSNRFGKRLFKIFFETYTEKVWGMPCSEIAADWAAQRIKDLSLLAAVKNAFFKQGTADKAGIIKTLIDSFDYPRHGPGMMWERVSEVVCQNGGRVRLGADVKKIVWANNRVKAVEIEVNGKKEFVEGSHFISSMPIGELIRGFEPPVPESVLQAATALQYRDFLKVAIIAKKADVFPDHWIYVHDPNVKVGRIQNFKNWSKDMVPDSAKTCLGLEYFCFVGDGLWNLSDRELIALGTKELETLGLIRSSEVEDGFVIRAPKAYPVYDFTYRESLQVIRRFLERIDNLQLVGRNGMHKYNNQDHSMLTAMLAVKNIMGASFDLWSVNGDQDYHETVRDHGEREADEFADLASTQPFVPERRATLKCD
ncbi:MAG: NAD(P)/FAD-dependent oxidoreductase, partial [Candidatus Binatia bacterium]|nr:NAD(P)/FAD-dependent oxidoreductase [Candidatus Binatia bacterium]